MTIPLRFLADECIPTALLNAVRTIEPAIDIVGVGEPGGPPKGTPDESLLRLAFQMGRVLMTRDRNTMLATIKKFLKEGNHTHGVVALRGLNFTAEQIAVDIRLIWFATDPSEWRDRTDFIPYR